jgi:predicted oxidoreductase
VVVIRGFVFKCCIFLSRTGVCVLEETTSRAWSTARVGSSAAHVIFTVARQVPGHVVSRVVFRGWCSKLVVSVVVWHN